MIIKNYNRYILKNFLFCFTKVTFVFGTVVIVMNLLEEINFFKDDNEGILLMPIFLTLLNMPSILFELFPFIFLISTLFFFIESIDNDEINVFKLYGITNLKIIQILATLSFVIGLVIILFFYNISANLNIQIFEKQELLEIFDLKKKLEKIHAFIEKETSVLSVEKKIRG